MRTIASLLLVAACAALASQDLPPFLEAYGSENHPNVALGKPCLEKVKHAIDLASEPPKSPQHAKKAQRKTLRAAEDAVTACHGHSTLLGGALSVRAGTLMSMGDSQQAALDFWSALGLTGFLEFDAQANATAQLAGGSASHVAGVAPREQREARIRDLVWASQALQALAISLERSGFGDQAREAHAASQEYTLQRWSLQSSIPGLKSVTGQREIDDEEAGRRLRTQEIHAEYNKQNPSILEQVKVRGKFTRHLTWGDSESKEDRRLRRGPTRRIVRNLQALSDAMDRDNAAWDTEGGLRSIEPIYSESWGEANGPYMPQFVPEDLLSHATEWSGRAAAVATDVAAAHASAKAHAAPLGAMCQLPATYQYGPTSGATTFRQFEGEMFFAVFEDVFVEGPAGIVYDDSAIYLNSHAEHVELASAFVGDGGTGAGSERPRTVVHVPSAISLVHSEHFSYQQWVADILPRFFMAVEHLKNTAESAQRAGKQHAEDIRNMKIIVPGAVPFVGAFMGMLGIAMDSVILYVPSHTVVHADRLWMPDWSAPRARRVPPPRLTGHPSPAEGMQQSISADGSVQSQGHTGDIAVLPDHLAQFDPTTFARLRRQLLEGDVSLYTTAPAESHMQFRTANNATCKHWAHRLAGKRPLRSFDKSAAEVEARAKPGTVIPSPSGSGVQVFGEKPQADRRTQSKVAPRAPLHLLRQQFAEKVIPDPPKDVQLDITQEVARAAEAEHGEKHRKRRGQRKFKKRKRNKSKSGKNKKPEKGEWEDAPPAWRMYGGYGGPFTWDNGTVLAYPPIRTVVVVTRDLDSFVDVQNSQAVLDAVHGFMQEAVEEVHHGGALPRDPLTHALLPRSDGKDADVFSPATVMKVESSDNDTMVQMTHPMVAEHYYAADVRAAHDGGVLYERALLRALDEEEYHAETKAARAAEVDASTIPVAATVRMFQQADIVVGVSGSGLTNVLFCPPTASVIEVAQHAAVNRESSQLATALGLDHWLQLSPVNATVSSTARRSALEKRSQSAAAQADSEGGAGGLAQRAAPVTAGPLHAGVEVNTEHLRGTLSAVLAKRVQVNAAAYQRAVQARTALWERGLLDSKAQKRVAAAAAKAAASAAAEQASEDASSQHEGTAAERDM